MQTMTLEDIAELAAVDEIHRVRQHRRYLWFVEHDGWLTDGRMAIKLSPDGVKRARAVFARHRVKPEQPNVPFSAAYPKKPKTYRRVTRVERSRAVFADFRWLVYESRHRVCKVLIDVVLYTSLCKLLPKASVLISPVDPEAVVVWREKSQIVGLLMPRKEI